MKPMTAALFFVAGPCEGLYVRYSVTMHSNFLYLDKMDG